MISIGSINSFANVGMAGMAPPPPPPMGAGQTLTDEQKSQLQEILDQYDSENITDEEMKSMLDEIKEAGIAPGEDLKNALEEAGFELKPPQGGPPPMGINGAMGARPAPPQFVTDFMDKAVSGEVTEDDVAAFLENIRSQNQDLTGLLINEQY